MNFDLFNKKKLKNLEESLILKDNEINELKHINKELEKENITYKTKLTSNEGKITELEKIHSNYQKELEKEFDKRLKEALQANDKKHEEKFNSLSKDLTDKDNEIYELSNEFKTLKRKYKGSQITIKNLNEKLDGLEPKKNIFTELEEDKPHYFIVSKSKNRNIVLVHDKINSRSISLLTCENKEFCYYIKDLEKERFEKEGYFNVYRQTKQPVNHFKNYCKIKNINDLKQLYKEFNNSKKEFKRTKPYKSTPTVYDDTYIYDKPFIHHKYSNNPLRINVDLYERIDELADKGMSIGNIAKETSVLNNMVSLIISRMNNKEFRKIFKQYKEYGVLLDKKSKQYASEIENKTLKSSDKLLSLTYSDTSNNEYKGFIYDDNKQGSFGSFETETECIKEQERIIKQYDETGEYERLKIKKNGQYRPLPHEKKLNKWNKGLKWVKGKLHINNKDTNITRLVISDIQSLRASGHNLDNIYAEFSTRYPTVDNFGVHTIFSNLDQPDFEEFYDKGAI